MVTSGPDWAHLSPEIIICLVAFNDPDDHDDYYYDYDDDGNTGLMKCS